MKRRQFPENNMVARIISRLLAYRMYSTRCVGTFMAMLSAKRLFMTFNVTVIDILRCLNKYSDKTRLLV